MNSNKQLKPVYFIVTDTEIYRTDLILQQIDEWIEIFKTGKIIRSAYGDNQDLEEFEAHLQKTFESTQKLLQNDLDF